MMLLIKTFFIDLLPIWSIPVLLPPVVPDEVILFFITVVLLAFDSSLMPAFEFVPPVVMVLFIRVFPETVFRRYMPKLLAAVPVVVIVLFSTVLLCAPSSSLMPTLLLLLPVVILFPTMELFLEFDVGEFDIIAIPKLLLPPPVVMVFESTRQSLVAIPR